MTEERIITGAIVTTGEKNDGKQLEELVSFVIHFIWKKIPKKIPELVCF